MFDMHRLKVFASTIILSLLACACHEVECPPEWDAFQTDTLEQRLEASDFKFELGIESHQDDLTGEKWEYVCLRASATLETMLDLRLFGDLTQFEQSRIDDTIISTPRIFSWDARNFGPSGNNVYLSVRSYAQTMGCSGGSRAEIPVLQRVFEPEDMLTYAIDLAAGVVEVGSYRIDAPSIGAAPVGIDAIAIDPGSSSSSTACTVIFKS